MNLSDIGYERLEHLSLRPPRNWSKNDGVTATTFLKSTTIGKAGLICVGETLSSISSAVARVSRLDLPANSWIHILFIDIIVYGYS